MPPSVAAETQVRQVNLSDLKPRMAKAQVNKVDVEARVLVGRALMRTRLVVGWTQKEFAAAFNRDQALVNRWETGTDRPPFDELLFHEVFGPALVIELARMLSACDVKTTIEIRRRA